MKKLICLLPFFILILSCDRNALSEWEESKPDNSANDEVSEVSDDNTEPEDTSVETDDQASDLTDEEETDENSESTDEDESVDSVIEDEDEMIDDEASDEPPLGGDCGDHEDCPSTGICDENICVNPYGFIWTVTIVSVTLDENDPATGELWDNGLFGIGDGDPDPYVMMFQNGNLIIETEKGDETQSVTFSDASASVGFTSSDIVSFQVFEYDSTVGDNDDPAGEFADIWNGSLPGPMAVKTFRAGEVIYSGSGTQELVVTVEKN